MHTINYNRDSEGSGRLDSGYEWLAGLVPRVSLQGLQGGSEYFGGPNMT